MTCADTLPPSPRTDRVPLYRWPVTVFGGMLKMTSVMLMVVTIACAKTSQVTPGQRLFQVMTDSERTLLLGSTENGSQYDVIPHRTLSFKRRNRRDLGEEGEHANLDFHAMGRPFKLKLYPNTQLKASTDAVFRIHNRTEPLEDPDCYYHGYSSEDPGSSAAMSLCNDVRGVIHTSDGTYNIRPLPEALAKRSGFFENDVERPLLIVKRETPTDYICPHALRRKKMWSTGMYPFSTSRRRRRKRKKRAVSGSVVIETAVFIDQALYDVMRRTFPAETERELTTFVLTMMNAVQLLFQHKSLGHSPSIQLVLLEVLKYQPKELTPSDNIDTYLTNFCIWQHSRRHYGKTTGPRWDHALLLSGINMYVVDESGRRKRHVVGLAPVSGMCNPLNSCTISEGTSFQTVLVAAHEMGHSLGMEHDGPQDGNHCDADNYIMSPTLGAGKTTWSACSRQYLEKFLRTQQATCLQPSSSYSTDLLQPPPDKLPGQMYDADYQCALRHGDGSRRSQHQSPEEMCRMLRCDTGYGGKGISFAAHPALEGTSCDREKWCRGGRCVTIQNDVANTIQGRVQNGGWSAWSSFTPCASECVSRGISPAVGVMLSQRRCDNPRPQNGGRFCEGRDRRIKMCDAATICSTSTRRIALEDFISDTCRQAASQDSTLEPSGTQFPSQENSHSCYVWCHKRGGGYMTQGWTVPDGTPCWRGYQHNQNQYCVKGECQAFDCNGHSTDQPGAVRCAAGAVQAPVSEIAWGPWHQVSECRGSCTIGGMGFQLVARECNSVSGCAGMRESFRLCNSSKSTCPTLAAVEQYASEVCQRYRVKYPTVLSGKGRQLPARPGNIHSPCIVACQDRVWKDTHYQMDVYEDGKFPFGTSCGSGDFKFRGYCLNGRCVDFDADGIPKTKDASHTFDARRVLSRIRRRDTSGIGHTLNAIHDSPSTFIKNKAQRDKYIASLIAKKQFWPTQDAGWVVEMSECSALCGGGTKNISVVCLAGDMVVDDWFCSRTSKPGEEGVWPCNPQPCTGRWQVREWSHCSVSCGKGVRRREIMCLQKLDSKLYSMVDHRMCSGEKPRSTEPCILPPCT